VRPELKLTAFIILGTLFGVLCCFLGARNGNYWLLTAGVAAVGFGLCLGIMMVIRQTSRK
jgi:hypothetical protein